MVACVAFCVYYVYSTVRWPLFRFGSRSFVVTAVGLRIYHAFWTLPLRWMPSGLFLPFRVSDYAFSGFVPAVWLHAGLRCTFVLRLLRFAFAVAAMPMRRFGHLGVRGHLVFDS